MAYDNDLLIDLHQKVARKKFLENSLRSLNRLKYEMRTNVLQLKDSMEKEQQDVEDLKKPSLASFFYNVTGKMDAKLDKEYKESREASDNYNTAALELSSIEDDLERAELEYRTLGDCEKAYKQAFEEKVKLIIASDLPDSDRVRNLDDYVKSILKEIAETEETTTVGRDAKSSAEYIILLEEEAEEQARCASYSDNGFTRIAARENEKDRLRLASEQAVVLKNRLCIFRDKLIKVSAFAKNYDDISSFLRFLDWNFNTDSVGKLLYPESLIRQIDPVINMLYRILETIEKKYAEVYKEFETLVLQIML